MFDGRFRKEAPVQSSKKALEKQPRGLIKLISALKMTESTVNTLALLGAQDKLTNATLSSAANGTRFERRSNDHLVESEPK